MCNLLQCKAVVTVVVVVEKLNHNLPVYKLLVNIGNACF